MDHGYVEPLLRRSRPPKVESVDGETDRRSLREPAAGRESGSLDQSRADPCRPGMDRMVLKVGPVVLQKPRRVPVVQERRTSGTVGDTLRPPSRFANLESKRGGGERNENVEV
jgi:hypothetical protein